MDIEFILEDDLPTVLGRIVSDTNPQHFKVQLNTVLILATEKQLSLTQFIDMVRPYLDDKDPDWRKKAMRLLGEVIKRKRDFRVGGEEGLRVLGMLEAKVLDVPMAGESIQAVAELVSLIITPEMSGQLISLFENPKFHPTSHRQQVRLCCYRILLQICLKCPDSVLATTAKQSKFMRIVLDTTYEERDPRNILKVFRLYQWLLENINNQQLIPFRETMYENLEAYYPIDFIGDGDQQGDVCSIEELIQGLDDCITDPLFTDQCFNTLLDKMATPPIKQFLPTLIKYISKNRKNIKTEPKITTILRKSFQSQFIEEADIHQQLLNCIDAFFSCDYFKKPFPAVSQIFYEDVYIIYKTVVDQLLQNHAGFVLKLTKVLCKNKNTQQIVRRFIILNSLSFSQTAFTSNKFQLYMGLLMVALTDNNIDQNTRNSIIKLTQKAYRITSQCKTLKIVLIKILMLISKEGTEFSEFIINDAIGFIINKSNQVFLRQAFVDFITLTKNNRLMELLKSYQNQLLTTQKIDDLDVEILVYSALWSENDQLINRVLNLQSQQARKTAKRCFLEQIWKNPKAKSILLKIEYGLMPATHLKQYRNIVKSVYQKKLGEVNDFTEQTAALSRSLDQNNLSFSYVYLHQWFINEYIERQAKHKLEQLCNTLKSSKFSEQTVETLLFKELLSQLTIEIPLYETSQEFKNLITVSQIRKLNKTAIINLKKQLQADKADMRILKQVSFKNEHDNPVLRQVLSYTILPPLLGLAEKGHDLKYLFLLLQSIPVPLLSAYNQRIISVVLGQLEKISDQEEVLQLSLEIIVQYFSNLKENTLEKVVVPVVLKKLKNGKNLPMNLILTSFKLLFNCSKSLFAINIQKSVIPTIQPYLGHSKRKVRQAALTLSNRWYSL